MFATIRPLTPAVVLASFLVMQPSLAGDDDPSPAERCWEAYLSRLETCIDRYGLEAEGKIDPEIRRLAAQRCIESAGEALEHCLEQVAGGSESSSRAINGGRPVWIDALSAGWSETLVVDLRTPAAEGTLLRLAGTAIVEVTWDDGSPWPGLDAAAVPELGVPEGTRRITLRARRPAGSLETAWVSGMLEAVDVPAEIPQN